MDDSHNTYKVVLLGEGCVGKTSLVLRYSRNEFVENHVTTIQASFTEKRLNIDGKSVKLNIWDTAGQERFHALGAIYYRDANGALLVYDITDRSSFERVQNWVKELRQMLGTDILLVIAGNKCDLERQRSVSTEEAEKYAASVGAKHFLTSAKMNKNISEVFLFLAQRMLATVKKSSAADVGGTFIDFDKTTNTGAGQDTGGGCC
eukprot:TRINITY_DN3317_c0_g4_i1.p1 TRINITY_DN3317_c0_g4~~TRINITY_DN3317_c0_g4_i1.p1  ORF type:complete len:205 (-),score=72.51 TRINITY_DN3317_c0_g4_i1:261-875(-)